MKSGMTHLVEAFYLSIMEDAPVPIPYQEILLTVRIMDAIFAQLGTNRSEIQHSDQSPLQAAVSG